MSKGIPFAALLPPPNLAQQIACPPYDVIDSDEARALAQNNPHSLLHITKAEIDLPPGGPTAGDAVCARARENFNRFLREGWLVPSAPAFYVCRIEQNGHAQTGLVAAVSVDDYDEGLVRRHERTRKDKEDERTELALALGAHPEPVLLACRSDAAFRNALQAGVGDRPLFDVAATDGSRHTLWRIQHPQPMAEALAALPALYIADGHHRSAVASRVRAARRQTNPAHTGTEASNFFPAVIFPHDEVRVYRYEWDGPENERPPADVTIEEIMDLADAGGILPPKSTWFAPKLLSGLFLFPF